MKATGIVRRIDDLGRVVIPKEIRRTMRIREGDPLLTTLTLFEHFCLTIFNLYIKIKEQEEDRKKLQEEKRFEEMINFLIQQRNNQ